MAPLNWTIEVIIAFIASGIMAVAFWIALQQYRQRKERHALFMSLAWLSYMAQRFIEGLSYLLLDKVVFMVSGWLLIPQSFCMVFLVDSLSREHSDPKKIGFLAALGGFVWSRSIDLNAYGDMTFPTGEKSLMMLGDLRYYWGVWGLLICLLYLFYMVKVHRRAPRTLKRYSAMLVIGAICLGVLPVAFALSSLTTLLPGCSFLAVAVGAIVTAYTFRKENKLAYILPFKVLRLMVLETSSGIALFTHTWKGGKGLADETFFSGMLQGISLIVKESINKGNIQEVKMDEAVMLLQPSKSTYITCALVATQSSRFLRNCLKGFCDLFEQTFSKAYSMFAFVSQFEGATTLVEKVFPFVPE